MAPKAYFAALRSKLVAQVGEIKNSNGYWSWDNTEPNWVIKRHLQEIRADLLESIEKFGLFIMTRHCDCENKKHRYCFSSTHSVEIETPYDERGSFKTGFTWGKEFNGFIWTGDQLYQGKRYCVCPCSSKNSPTDHHVIDDIVIRSDSDISCCDLLTDVLIGLSSAIVKAGDKRPRSAIREDLLMLILQINDFLLPEPMEQYAKAIAEGKQ